MKTKIFFVIAALLAAVVFAASGFAETGSVIISVKGEPKIMKNGSDSWTACRADMGVDTGDRIKTLPGEEVQVSFADRANFIKINEDSDVILLIARDSGSVELLSGEALALIKTLREGSTFEVKTPSGVSGARGTGWGARTDGTRSRFSSYENSIYVRGIDPSGNVMAGELLVDEGMGTVLDKFEKPEKLERLTGADMDRWREWRDSLRDQPSRDRDNSLRDRLDNIGDSENFGIDQLEARKQDVSEVRDIQRIEDRTPARESSPAARDNDQRQRGEKGE